MDVIAQAAALLHAAQRVAALTGAGISKESGVPTFRDPMDGLWARFDPQELATPMAFQRNPRLVWEWYEYRRGLVAQARANPGHIALAQLAQRLPHFTLITQNVDSLHEIAGSPQVIHLHGQIAETRCFFNCQGDPTLVDLAAISYDPEQKPPNCPHCGRWLRPNVVWFHETLPHDALQAAIAACEAADVILVVGTSGLVEPAASLPRLGKVRGAQLIEVNPEWGMLSRVADVKLRGAAGVLLPQVLAALDAPTD